MKTTLEDVAQKADVSIASASHVLSTPPSVTEGLRQKVQNAALKLGYKQSRTASRTPKVKRVGLVLPDIQNPYFTQLISGLEDSARVVGFELILCNARMDPARETEHLEHLAATSASGIIYIPFTETPPPQIMDWIEKKHPLVFLDREMDLPNICSVVSDNTEGAYQAASYLLKLRHSDILFLSGPRHLSASVARTAGFQKAIREAGLKWQKTRTQICDTSFEDAHQKTLEALDTGLSFSAVFATNDLMAFGAWKALESRGLNVPDDISIIGYDEIALSSYISLTTIAQPAYEIGRNAALLLDDLISGRRHPPQRIQLRDSLIIRNSCRQKA